MDRGGNKAHLFSSMRSSVWVPSLEPPVASRRGRGSESASGYRTRPRAGRLVVRSARGQELEPCVSMQQESSLALSNPQYPRCHRERSLFGRLPARSEAVAAATVARMHLSQKPEFMICLLHL